MSAVKQLALRFDYGALDADTSQFVEERAERIHKLARATAAGIVQIGQYLTEVKERLKHGQFLSWIDFEFGWKERSARAFMMVYDRFKSANFADLEIDVSALYLIAAPKTPEPVRVEAIHRAEIGEHVTHSTVKAVVAEYNKTGNEAVAVGRLFDAVRTAQQQAAETRRQLPSPTEARRLAIESGAHTLDRNGVYQPPMTVTQQEDWRDDLMRLSPLAEFIRWVTGDPRANVARLDASEAVKIIKARQWWQSYKKAGKAAEWLTDFVEELSCQNDKASKT